MRATQEKATIPPEDSLSWRVDVAAKVRTAMGEADEVMLGRRAVADRRKSLETIAAVVFLLLCLDGR